VGGEEKLILIENNVRMKHVSELDTKESVPFMHARECFQLHCDTLCNTRGNIGTHINMHTRERERKVGWWRYDVTGNALLITFSSSLLFRAG
jgi:hypothetical protein